MIHYKCQDCGDVDMAYVECVRIDWNAHAQDWDIGPNDKSDKRCSDGKSWNIEEYEEAE